MTHGALESFATSQSCVNPVQMRLECGLTSCEDICYPTSSESHSPYLMTCFQFYQSEMSSVPLVLQMEAIQHTFVPPPVLPFYFRWRYQSPVGHAVILGHTTETTHAIFPISRFQPNMALNTLFHALHQFWIIQHHFPTTRPLARCFPISTFFLTSHRFLLKSPSPCHSVNECPFVLS